MEASLGGYPWLPRMIDKARAARADTLGTYYRYPCPIDAVCLRRLGVSADAFAEIAAAAVTDEEVLDLLVAAGARPPRVATFDPIRLNARLHLDGS
jgi:hypothetical protein